LLAEVMLSEIGSEVVSPAMVAVAEVPMIRLPAVDVALPSTMEEVVPSERKSVI
jgi:hypothetical protein